MSWLVNRQLAAVGEAQRCHQAESFVADLPGELDPLCLELLDVVRMSSHIRYRSCRLSPPSGWAASSAGGSAKISQPPPASTEGSPTTSRKNARRPSASSRKPALYPRRLRGPSQRDGRTVSAIHDRPSLSLCARCTTRMSLPATARDECWTRAVYDPSRVAPVRTPAGEPIFGEASASRNSSPADTLEKDRKRPAGSQGQSGVLGLHIRLSAAARLTRPQQRTGRSLVPHCEWNRSSADAESAPLISWAAAMVDGWSTSPRFHPMRAETTTRPFRAIAGVLWLESVAGSARCGPCSDYESAALTAELPAPDGYGSAGRQVARVRSSTCPDTSRNSSWADPGSRTIRSAPVRSERPKATRLSLRRP
jgi:hypothetical protein